MIPANMPKGPSMGTLFGALAVVGCTLLAPAATAFAVCGDNVVDSGEDCDGGSVNPSDCCSNSCTWEAPGKPCADSNACIYSTCDGAGACVDTTSCQTAGFSRLTVKNTPYWETNAITWKWRADGVGVTDFGDPTTTSDIALCIWDNSEPYIKGWTYATEAGDMCKGRALWRARTGGFSYSSKGCTFPLDGVRTVSLRAGRPTAFASIAFKMRGWLVRDMPWTAPLHVRMVSGDSPICWEATFPTFAFKPAPETTRGTVTASVP